MAVALKHTAEWFDDRLYKFFTTHFGKYAFDAEFLDPPHTNQYVFDITRLNKRVILTCNDDGSIDRTERKYPAGGQVLFRLTRKAETKKKEGDEIYVEYMDSAESAGNFESEEVAHYEPNN